MYFYKEALNNIFHVGNDILPAGRYILRIHQNETAVSIESADTHGQTMGSTEIIYLQKEDDSYYTDLAELLVATKDFFKGGYAGDVTSLDGRVTAIEDTQIKILYYEQIDGTATSGQISIPAGSEILFDQWEGGADAVVSNIPVDKPDYKDTGVDVTSLDSSGNYTLSGTLLTNPGAFIYWILVPISDLPTLNPDFIIDQSITFPAGGSLYNVITVAISGGDFVDLALAIASITDSSSTNRYTIQVGPGVYTLNNDSGPVQIPNFVSIEAIGGRGTIIQPSTPVNDMFLGGIFTYLVGLLFSGNTGTSYVLKQLSAGTTIVSNCVMRDAANGFYVNHADGAIEVNELTINNPDLTTTTYGARADLGSLALDGINMRETSIVTTGVYVTGASTTASIHNAFILSPNTVTAISINDGAFVIGNSLNIGYVNDGLVISGNNTNISIDSVKILYCQNDGFRIDNLGTNIRVSLLSTTISECTGFNFNILNPNSITTGNGFSELNKSYIVSGAKLYAYILDIAEDDEGLNILGELHVGQPNSPAESVLGEGDSYTTGMLIYTFDGTSTYVDITEAASTASGSSFSPPNGNIGTCFYIASILANSEDFLRHYGIKLKQIHSGGSSTPHDITVTGVTTPVAVAGDYGYAGQYNNNPYYLRVTTEDIWVYNLKGTWVFDDEAPGSISNSNQALYTSSTLEGAYVGTAGNTGTPTLAINYALLRDWQFEYYDELTTTWLPFNTAETMSNAPYIQVPQDSNLDIAGSFQVRYDPALTTKEWGKTDLMGIGTSYYWIRARIVNTLITLPEFEQFKVHSNRMEINGDGWPEYFGTARPFSTLPWDLGLVEAANASPGNQDIFLSDNLAIGRVENSFANGAVDRIGFNSYLPFDLDTSGGIYLRFSYIGNSATPGDVEWVVRWGYTNDGDNVYRSEAAAPATGPNEQSITQVDTVNGIDSQHTTQVQLDIASMVSRRVGSQNGYGDMIWVTIERLGGAAADTYGGAVAMLNILPIYAKWCEGGHI